MSSCRVLGPGPVWLWGWERGCSLHRGYPRLGQLGELPGAQQLDPRPAAAACGRSAGGSGRQPPVQWPQTLPFSGLSPLFSLVPSGYRAKNKNSPGYCHSYLVLLFLSLFFPQMPVKQNSNFYSTCVILINGYIVACCSMHLKIPSFPRRAHLQ